jgi:hypothetical protein
LAGPGHQGILYLVLLSSCGHCAAFQHPCARDDSLPCIEERLSPTAWKWLMCRAVRMLQPLLSLDQEKADMHMRRLCAGSQEAGRQGTEGEGAGVLAAQGQERCRRCLWRQGSCQVTQLHQPCLHRTMSLHQAIHTPTHGVRFKPHHAVGHYVSSACPSRSILWQYS